MALVCMQCGADAAVGWHVIGYIVDNLTSPVFCTDIYIYEHVHVCGYVCMYTGRCTTMYSSVYVHLCVYRQAGRYAWRVGLMQPRL